MKADTQALRLEKMMQKHKLFPEYELALPLVLVKKNVLKKLTCGDLFLLGMHRLEMILLKEGKVIANVVLSKSGNSSKIKIIKLNRNKIIQTNDKKYEIVKFTFGLIQSEILEVGHQMEITPLNLEEISLHVKEENIAKGSLVNVDEEIAVQIDEHFRRKTK